MESLAMDVSFIKKEEPVDYALIVPEANQDTIYEKSIGADVNDPEPFLDIYTISIKEEPQDNYNLANEGDDSSEDNVEEDKQSDEGRVGLDKSVHMAMTAVNSFSKHPNVYVNAYLTSSNVDINFDWTISSLKTMKTMKSKRKGPFKCEMCSSVYKKKFALKSHIQAHIINGLEKECCNVCNKFYPKSCMEMHLLLHKGPPYHCQICAKEFTKHACYVSLIKVSADFTDRPVDIR
ncbi:Zinc finger protein [Pseudolycoriella hygida]|uniref:Zinc finger protein n=1 Tax=Pseudolycoriella hygida TaxID=35572 RepID=A0A9Q0S9W2_9DIPT|nr:Zinc finger protein [Pseudolycoriella hygida]